MAYSLISAEAVSQGTNLWSFVLRELAQDSFVLKEDGEDPLFGSFKSKLGRALGNIPQGTTLHWPR